ncbi:hypothetical protein OOT46_29200 [Aquabacterium sp. A7-Y]|uniref:hypothetical protein n=1 Tax=Aquabacterium sp. A7-Y TaxID=1349605 RepID=UPI00223E39C5|nr:hypothetical protein [Aquabacterium sp. A7-Y]MCW7541879.1 hypothetical protein [Aquabacterium sp. A7-Y]
MRALSAAVTAALSGDRVVLGQLIYMALSEPVYLNTTGWDLTWDGKTWRGAGGVGRIDVLEDGPGEIKGTSFELPGVLSEYLALALAEPVQGRAVEVRTAIFDADTCQVLDAPIEWAGQLDIMSIVETLGTATIAVTAEHIGIDLLRPSSVRYSDADQRRLVPGDQGFEYVIDQTEQSIVWPAASFYRR